MQEFRTPVDSKGWRAFWANRALLLLAKRGWAWGSGHHRADYGSQCHRRSGSLALGTDGAFNPVAHVRNGGLKLRQIVDAEKFHFG